MFHLNFFYRLWPNAYHMRLIRIMILVGFKFHLEPYFDGQNCNAKANLGTALFNFQQAFKVLRRPNFDFERFRRVDPISTRLKIKRTRLLAFRLNAGFAALANGKHVAPPEPLGEGVPLEVVPDAPYMLEGHH